MAFLATLAEDFSYTGDRLEFLGRNGSLTDPIGLQQVQLSGRVGAAMVPCAAILVPVTLEPGASTEVTFLLGECATWQEAKDLVSRFRQEGAVQGEFDRVRSTWDELIGRLMVRTPEPSWITSSMAGCCTR